MPTSDPKKNHCTFRLTSSELSLLHSIDSSPSKAFRSLLEHYRYSKVSMPFDQFLLQLYPFLAELYNYLEDLEADPSKFDSDTSLYLRSRISDFLDLMFRHYP